MANKEDFKSTMTLVGNTITDIAQILCEKNKIRAHSTRVKQIIKGDTQTRDKAYIELGKFFYDNLRDGASKENEELCAIVDKMNARIEKASIKYIELQNLQNSTQIKSENADKLKEAFATKAEQIKTNTVDEFKEYSTKAKDFANDQWDKTKTYANDQYSKVKTTIDDKADEIKSQAEEAVEEIKSAVNEKVETIKDVTTVKEEDVDFILSEESPDSFEF